jgi:hypothetical protein
VFVSAVQRYARVSARIKGRAQEQATRSGEVIA